MVVLLLMVMRCLQRLDFGFWVLGKGEKGNEEKGKEEKREDIRAFLCDM